MPSTDQDQRTSVLTELHEADGGRSDREITLASERALAAPLGALRVLLEGARGAESSEARAFADRALAEIRRAQDAAGDLIAWTLPRATHCIATSIGEIAQSLRESLSPAERRACHFVIDQPGTRLHADGRLVVSSLARSIVARLRDPRESVTELMLHAHANDGFATFNIVDADAPESIEVTGASAPQRSVADALLERDIERIGGRVSTHFADRHRCAVIVVPLDARKSTTEASA